MAVNAYILINLDPAHTPGAVEKLRSVPRAVVREVLGPYDVVVEVEADTAEDITAVLRHRIRPVNGVTNTVTCMWF